MSEACPKCGSKVFVIARDMHATRFCKCGETWLPKPKEENKTVFEVGDIVEAFGLKGIVVKIRDCQYFPIQVKFCNDNSATFCSSGKLQSWHLEPSLKLIEKAKKKVKKKFYVVIHDSDIKKGRVDDPLHLYEDKVPYPVGCQLTELELEVEE